MLLANSLIETYRKIPNMLIPLVCSNPNLYPYPIVPAAIKTDVQPSASRTSVCV